MTEHVPVTKNEEEELPVPTEWRKPLSDIVECLASGEFSKLSSLPAFTLEGGWGWQAIEAYIKDYGRKLTSLPEESWRTSIYLWMGSGSYWEVLWIYLPSKKDVAIWCCLYEYIQEKVPMFSK